MTDAGRSAEWSELLDALAARPSLAERTLILPGNHDLNIVDRANPARLDLPISPNRMLRRLRFLSAVEALHGERVCLIDQVRGCLAGSLSEALKPHRAAIAQFAEAGKPRLPGPKRTLGSGLSHGVAAGSRRRSRHYPAELERKYAFFVHQRSWNDFSRTSTGNRDCCRTIPSGVLDPRASPPRDRISQGRESTI